MNRRRFFSMLSRATVAVISVPFLPKPNIKPQFCVPYTGTSLLKTGYVYAPYIPLYQTHI